MSVELGRLGSGEGVGAAMLLTLLQLVLVVVEGTRGRRSGVRGGLAPLAESGCLVVKRWLRLGLLWLLDRSGSGSAPRSWRLW